MRLAGRRSPRLVKHSQDPVGIGQKVANPVNEDLTRFSLLSLHPDCMANDKPVVTIELDTNVADCVGCTNYRVNDLLIVFHFVRRWSARKQQLYVITLLTDFFDKPAELL